MYSGNGADKEDFSDSHFQYCQHSRALLIQQPEAARVCGCHQHWSRLALTTQFRAAGDFRCCRNRTRLLTVVLLCYRHVGRTASLHDVQYFWRFQGVVVFCSFRGCGCFVVFFTCALATHSVMPVKIVPGVSILRVFVCV